MILSSATGAAVAYAWAAGSLRFLVLLSVFGFILSFVPPELVRLPGLCGSLGFAMVAGTLSAALRLWPIDALVFAWAAMLLAMMPPLLARPVEHVLVSSFGTRRGRAITLFSFGYALVWVGAGVILVPLTAALGLVAPGGAAWLSFAGAVIWSCSPAAQGARNRCHGVRRIAAFGLAADRNCVVYGVAIGSACLGVCGPWMVVAISVRHGHEVVMVLITLMLFLDRLAPARRPRWGRPPVFDWLSSPWRRQKIAGTW